MLQKSASFDQLGHGKLWPSRRLAILQFKKKGLGRPSVSFSCFFDLIAGVCKCVWEPPSLWEALGAFGNVCGDRNSDSGDRPGGSLRGIREPSRERPSCICKKAKAAAGVSSLGIQGRNRRNIRRSYSSHSFDYKRKLVVRRPHLDQVESSEEMTKRRSARGISAGNTSPPVRQA